MDNNTSELTILQTIAYVSKSLPTVYKFTILVLLIALVGFCCLVEKLPSIMHEMPPVIMAIKETSPKSANQIDSIRTKTYVAKGYPAANEANQ